MVTILAAIAGALVASLVGYYLALRLSRRERLEKQRAETLAKISMLIYKVDLGYFQWQRQRTPEERTPEARKQMGKDAAKRLEVLIDYFHSHTVFLKPGTAKRVEANIDRLRRMGSDYYAALDRNEFELNDDLQARAEQMQDRVREMRDDLNREFREIMDPIEGWKSNLYQAIDWGARKVKDRSP